MKVKLQIDDKVRGREEPFTGTIKRDDGDGLWWVEFDNPISIDGMYSSAGTFNEKNLEKVQLEDDSS